MRFKTTHLFLAIPLFLSFQDCSSSEGGKNKTQEITVAEAKDAKKISKHEQSLRTETANSTTSCDLYFDFSATMKRAVNDVVIQGLITNAFDGLGAQDRIYSIGENKNIKEISGDKAAKQNSVLGLTNYTQKLTYMTPNINNILANPTKPAVMFTDFSVDEGEITKDFEGTSTFIRGSKYADQFEKWFLQGGTVKIYGKFLAEANVKTPVYVIVFMPSNLTPKNNVYRIVRDLDAKLSQDFNFEFNTHFGDVYSEGNEGLNADAFKIATSKSNNKLSTEVNNNLGESMIFASKQLIAKTNQKKIDSLKHAIVRMKLKEDPNCFLKLTEIKSESSLVVALSKQKWANRTAKFASDIYKPIVYNASNHVLEIGLNKTESNFYDSSRMVRTYISVSKVAPTVKYNEELAKKSLQYYIGKPKIMNNCLLASLDLAMKNVATKFNGNYPLYSVYTFINNK
jgi:hypothetical protein